MLPLLTITVFLSAALMFTLQPLVARLLLPVMGGSPAVWNTCMVFFQAVLLAGYAYAHAIGGMQRRGVAGAVHLGVLALGMAALPLALPAWAMDPPTGGGGGQAWWVLLVLTVVAGLPMFAVSATAPLAQRLLASTRHAAAGKPYFLYAASNAGSLIALLSYPLLIEPSIGLRDQGWVWMAGYGVFVAMAIGSVTLAMQVGFKSTGASLTSETKPQRGSETRAAASSASAPTGVWRDRAWWLALSAVPSSLLLGVTNYLSTDVAAIPLLWVVPLAVYLGTFIIAFSERGRSAVGPRLTTLLLPLVAVSIALTLQISHSLGVIISQQLLLLLVGALACHVELARRAPEPARLTEFYLVMSIGGVIGGVFNSLLAPAIFDLVIEYPIAVVATCGAAMLAAGLQGGAATMAGKPFWRSLAMDVLIAAALGILAWGIREALGPNFDNSPRSGRIISALPSIVLALLFCRARALRFSLTLAALFVVAWFQPLKGHEGGGGVLVASRTFFGVHRVTRSQDGKYHTLMHGTTVHGLQFTAPEHRGLPTTYYHPTGPIGHVFKALETLGRPESVAVVGLGAGALAAYARGTDTPVQLMDFYEIDPEVVRIAKDPALFTYLADSAAKQRFIIGDGRVALSRAEGEAYDLIVLDAFSSDAIPVHLLTREAIGVYLSRLAPGGLIAVHISNRHIDLVPVIDALARDQKLAAVFATDGNTSDDLWLQGKVASQWAVIARTGSDLRPLVATPGMAWGVPDRLLGGGAWTDDWSDVASHLRVFR